MGIDYEVQKKITVEKGTYLKLIYLFVFISLHCSANANFYC